jgi:hypothetical protein
MQEKRCRKCDVLKPLSAYDSRPTCKDGKRATCRRCRAGWVPMKNGVPVEPPKVFRRALDSKRYIITSAQNATPVEAVFFETLKFAAKAMDAELVVIPLRYHNPTSVWSKNNQDQEWWDPAVVPYLHNVRKKLNDNLILCADVKTQPTAQSPLTGFENLTGSESCLIGHAKMQFRSIPVPTGRYPKVLSTTGSCTRRNYSDTRAGKLGEFHHFLGAVIVEIHGKTFHLRQVNADRTDGSFTDLDKHYTAGAVFDAPPALGLVLGDTHVRVNDPKVDAATFGPGGIVETLQPQTLVWHDLFDGETVNPHEVGNPFQSEARRKAGRQDVFAEIKQSVEFAVKRSAGRQAVVVDSNHHAFLTRWINRTNWKEDLKNARFYCETVILMLDSAGMEAGGAEYQDPYHHWVKELSGGSLRCLGANESFKLADNECGLHGNDGPNGARGTPSNLSRLGCKTITGHTHSPCIEGGNYQTGTSSMRRLSYQRGPSSHQNTHVVVYASGKRALITVVDGAWRA